MKQSRYRIVLWALAALLLVCLFACAKGKEEVARKESRIDTVSAAGAWKGGHPMRLLLAGSSAHDSVKIASELFVDQSIRSTLDSIPSAQYLTLNYRDSLAGAAVKHGEPGITLEELGERLKLDGAIFTKVARFGSMLAVDLRIVNPKTREVFYHDVSFSLIRYRDSSGSMLIGPALYDAIRKSLGKYFGVPHVAAKPVATEPLVIGSIVVEKSPALKQIAIRRESLTQGTVKALAEYAILHFPELVAFDIDSRSTLYEMFGIKGVENFVPMHAEERRTLNSVGVDRYVTGRVVPVGDSLRMELELHAITGATSDTLVDSNSRMYGINEFENSGIDEDFVVAFVDVAEPLYKREAERVRQRYIERGKQ